MINNVPVYDPKQIANNFNQFFRSTFSKPSDFRLPDMCDLPTPCSQLSRLEITKTEVLSALSNLKESKAFGCDEIHPKILKHCLPSLIDYIRSLFVKCLLIGRIPSEWKNHKISPIPTNRDLLDISIYRPIPLLCILSKVKKRRKDIDSVKGSRVYHFKQNY